MRKLILVLGLVLLCASFSYADEGKIVPASQQKPISKSDVVAKKSDGVSVIVEHEGDDAIGGMLALRLKEEFRKSPLFKLGDPAKKSIRIKITSQREFEGRPEIGSVYSLVISFADSDTVIPYFLNQKVGIVSQSTLEISVQKLMSLTDKIAEEYKYLFD